MRRQKIKSKNLNKMLMEKNVYLNQSIDRQISIYEKLEESYIELENKNLELDRYKHNFKE